MHYKIYSTLVFTLKPLVTHIKNTVQWGYLIITRVIYIWDILNFYFHMVIICLLYLHPCTYWYCGIYFAIKHCILYSHTKSSETSASVPIHPIIRSLELQKYNQLF